MLYLSILLHIRCSVHKTENRWRRICKTSVLILETFFPTLLLFSDFQERGFLLSNETQMSNNFTLLIILTHTSFFSFVEEPVFELYELDIPYSNSKSRSCQNHYVRFGRWSGWPLLLFTARILYSCRKFALIAHKNVSSIFKITIGLRFFTFTCRDAFLLRLPSLRLNSLSCESILAVLQFTVTAVH
jgi:hypothetical protein